MNGCSASSVQSLSLVWFFATTWTTAHQTSLSTTNSWSLLKLMSIELVMPSNHLILCRPLLSPPSIFPSIRFFSNESVLRIRWTKYWSFSFKSVLPMSIQDWFPLAWTGCSIVKGFKLKESSAAWFGIYVYLWLIHVEVWQKTAKFCKAIILQ